MADTNTLAALLHSTGQPGAADLYELGTQIGKLYTDHGLPIDMALDRLPYTKEQKIQVLHGALSWLVEHRRNSRATDKAIDRQRKANRTAMEQFLKSGETGIY